jgi:hypothetical protein
MSDGRAGYLGWLFLKAAVPCPWMLPFPSFTTTARASFAARQRHAVDAASYGVEVIAGSR